LRFKKPWRINTSVLSGDAIFLTENYIVEI
jgi:hypothetical protein